MDMFPIESIIQTYKYIAVCSTIFFVIKFVIFSTLGGASEVTGDFDAMVDTDAAFDFLSIQSILAFLMGFGWIGLASLEQWKLSVTYSIVAAIVVGLIFMFISAYLMFQVKKFNHIVKVDMKTALGTVGKAYTNINANSEGQIQIDINNQLAIKNAINATDIEIKAFESIKVVKVENDSLYIEKV